MEGWDQEELPAHDRALASAQKDGRIIVTNRLTGNFPGSPIELEFVFVLAGNKIASLEILS